MSLMAFLYITRTMKKVKIFEKSAFLNPCAYGYIGNVYIIAEKNY
jgi:hypothetical protein